MTIHLDVTIDARAEKVFEVLTNAEKFAAATGAPAEFEAEEGGAFSAFGGMITGRFVEIAAGERVVQAWRPKSWAPGVYSLVTFSLKPEGAKTNVSLTQVGYPNGEKKHLEGGWGKMYWDPISAFLK